MKRKFALAPLAALLIITACFASVAENPGGAERSPTTGLPGARPYRPVLVQISNQCQARPLFGLADADIVYEAIYWGPGHTRYLALFNDAHPRQVGPIRSTRVYWNEIREMWDCPFAFWGRQGSVHNRIDTRAFFEEHPVVDGMLFDGTAGSTAMFRITDRLNPHNAMVDTHAISTQHWPKTEQGRPYRPQKPSLLFSGGQPGNDAWVDSVQIAYSADDYVAEYVYEKDMGAFARWYDGRPQQDADGKSVFASNVFVLYMPHSFWDNDFSLPIIRTTGSGPLDAFINGTHVQGVWHREAIGDWFRLIGPDGEDIRLKPGKTFFQIVPMDMEIQLTAQDGSTSILRTGAMDSH